MRLLLDTHALLWWLADDPSLGPHARTLIGNPANEVLVSIASLWEIVVKVRVGKLNVNIDGVAAGIADQGFRLLELRQAHLKVLWRLPQHHRDPFDHLLIAQAIAEQAAFMSEDRHSSLYPGDRVLCSP